ncbi:DUF4432 family protein [Kaistia geumhonensis]|uniref:DUF4432 family protein n=1 Tax=Kaistia geumhonensis TaxID=410839 RepID=A0ABU0MAW5_9HYPH|nr:DUF4432 family protein [Kaistia geumhonensis]MCX5480382.1 DUF4432 family protein [Kaistia geumhonensis]MDQ0517918.1 hypothetical protein [Kaistia geumhonensis]
MSKSLPHRLPQIASADADIAAKSPDLRALGEIRLLSLEDGPGRGQRLLVARNAAGIGFEIAVDRGFDLSALSLGQVQLGWHSQNQMRYPAQLPSSEDGYGFLRNFDGFLVTCGLSYYGPPRRAAGDTTVSPHRPQRDFPQHGEIAAMPARLVGYGLDAEAGLIFAEGVVRQSGVFGDVLELHRRIELGLYDRTLAIADRVVNCGFNPAPHALLYHCNFGYPLLDATSELTGAFGDFARRFAELPPRPRPETREIVDHLTLPPDERGDLVVGIRNPAIGIGVELAYRQAQLPSLLVWRSYQSGVFALGIEPGTALPRIENGELLTETLEPRGSRDYAMAITVAAED